MPTQHKVALIDRIAGAGFRRLEATSFAHPRAVPQFADAEQVLAGITRNDAVIYRATCVNGRGIERAVATRREHGLPDEATMVISASAEHSGLAQRRSHAEILAEYAAAIPEALGSGLRLQGTIAAAWGSPLGDSVSFSKVMELVSFFVDQGCPRISLGDTTGLATPPQIFKYFVALQQVFPETEFVAHLHDSRGTAIANAFAAIDAGVTNIDSSIGGTGGHPAKIKYGGGHTGNACTEDLVFALDRAGIVTGIDHSALLSIGRDVERELGRDLTSRIVRLEADKYADAGLKSADDPNRVEV